MWYAGADSPDALKTPRGHREPSQRPRAMEILIRDFAHGGSSEYMDTLAGPIRLMITHGATISNSAKTRVADVVGNRYPNIRAFLQPSQSPSPSPKRRKVT